MTDAEDELIARAEPEPEETLAAPASPRTSDPLASLPRVAAPVFRPRNLWLRAFVAAAILGAVAVVVVELLLH